MNRAHGDPPVTRRQAASLIARAATHAVLLLGAWQGAASLLFVPAAWSRTNSPHNQRQPKHPMMTTSAAVSDPYRLPRHVIPTHYDLRIEPDLQSHSFTGHELVTLTITEPTTELLLNATELDISTATLSGEGQAPGTGTVRMDDEHQRCHITFSSVIPPGRVEVKPRFSRHVERQATRVLSQ